MSSARIGILMLSGLTALAACSGPADSSATTPPAVGQSRKLADGWVEVRPEANLSLKLRDGWNANRAERGSGPIVFTGPNGAQAVVWPMFVPKGVPMPTPTAVLTGFAQRAGGQFKWGNPTPFGAKALRMFGERGGAVAQASFVYSNTPAGMVGYWYLTSAPRASYAGLRPIFATLLQGVRLFGNSPSSAGATKQAALNYVTWREPNEGAYTTEVPKDWRVTGGIVRPDPLRLLDPVDMRSPDGQTYVFSGDRNLQLYKTPTQMEASMGMVEGGYNGAAMLMRYRPAAAFLPQYVQRRFASQCGGQVQIGKVIDQRELAAEGNQMLQASTAPGSFQRVDVGLIDFRCGSKVGLVQMSTYITGTNSQYGTEGFGIWQVVGVGGFIAAPAQAAQAGQAVLRLMSARKVNQQWAQGNRAMVAQINAISRNAAAEMSAQIASRYSVNGSSGTRSGGGSGDDLQRQWQNNIMDQTDVVDAANGTRYKVASGSNYYWINPAGTAITGTNAPSQPTVDFQQMTQLP